MEEAIQVREVPALPVLCTKATCRHEEISSTLAVILPKVFGSLTHLGVRPAGPPFCCYTDWRDEDCDLEGGIVVEGLVSGIGEIEGKQLGGGRCACYTHIGPYTELHGAYEMLMKYMQDNHLEPAGPPFEVYLTDPGKEPDQSKWHTDIYFPVK
jgi:AraC family transcriptional regulator